VAMMVVQTSDRPSGVAAVRLPSQGSNDTEAKCDRGKGESDSPAEPLAFELVSF